MSSYFPSNFRSALLLISVIGVLLGAWALFSSSPSLPSFAATKAAYRPSESWLLDRNSEVIAIKRIDPKVRRLEWVALSDISPAAQELLLQSEDKRFYEHGGVDWLALFSSAGSNLLHLFDDKRPRGASTLTMQLAGFLDHSLAPASSRRSLLQKWRQILAAREIEKTWSKQHILEAYFNLAAFRGELVGINTAAQALFHAQPSALNRAQSFLLMALLKGPMSKPEQVAQRACALQNTLQDERAPDCSSLIELAAYSLDAVNQHIALENIAPHLAQRMLNQPGTRVRTTLDASLQRFAMQSLRSHLLTLNEQNVRDGALIVIDNSSGDVLAYIGSSGELSDAAQVDGVTSVRQAGSTLKPFLYGSTLDGKLLTASSVLDDSSFQLNTPMGLYVPQNYDRDFKGPVSMRTALASSLNVPAVRTLSLLGVDHFVRTLRDFGFETVMMEGEHYGFSLALGGVDVRLLDLSNAYRVLANRGVWRPLRFSPDVHDAAHRRVLSSQAAFVIGNILSDKAARSMTFGLENPLATSVWAAVKTGTSKDMRDNWCIGYSERYTVGVWVGNFNGEPMYDVSGISGAAPIWRELMDILHKGRMNVAPTPPRRLIATHTHFEPPIESPRIEWYLKGTEISEVRLIPVRNDEGQSHATIKYPINGSTIAMDPDIPTNNQRVRFGSQGSEHVTWMLDGDYIGTGENLDWSPTGGKHILDLANDQGTVLDSISFEVRGAL